MLRSEWQLAASAACIPEGGRWEKTVAGTIHNEQTMVAPLARQGVIAFLEALPFAELPPISRILLYGSHARGDFHAESDIDVAVVLNGRPPAKGSRLELAHRLNPAHCKVLMELDANVSPTVIWEWEVGNPEKTLNPQFFRNVEAEGLEVASWRN